MEAPPGGMLVKEFNECRKREIESRYEKRENGWFCKKCGAKVQKVTCYVSEHEIASGGQHAGTGSVQKIPLPYCPQCEGKPQNTSTCVHTNLIPSELRPAFIKGG